MTNALDAAAEGELESASDGFWPDEEDQRAEHRDAIVDTVHMRDRWRAGEATTADVARLANRASEDQRPIDWPGWPTTTEAANDLIARLHAARDLLVVRDAALGAGAPSTG